MVANPAQAIAAVHRAVLLDATHNWSFLLEEITAIAGITGAVSGTGTRNDPWRVSLAAPGIIDIELAAWNAQTSGVATDPQKLRLGLRASVAQGSLDVLVAVRVAGIRSAADGLGHGFADGRPGSACRDPAHPNHS